MTDYRVIRTRKRNHSLTVRLPERSDTALIATLADDYRVARKAGTDTDIRFTRNGGARLSRNAITVYPRLFKIRKRSFSVRGKVNHD